MNGKLHHKIKNGLKDNIQLVSTVIGIVVTVALIVNTVVGVANWQLVQKINANDLRDATEHPTFVTKNEFKIHDEIVKETRDDVKSIYKYLIGGK